MTDFLDDKRSELSSRQGSPKRTVMPRAASTGGTGRRGPRIGSGKRAVQALAAITEKPGLTTAKLAARTGVSKTYLPVVLRTLISAGKIRSEDGRWHPAQGVSGKE
jgi:hypothetical protein